jgi:hypothetical protein
VLRHPGRFTLKTLILLWRFFAGAMRLQGTLEALEGLEQTEVLFERLQILKRSPPITSEEYKTATKYFRNIRQRQECALPTMTECENSGVGLAFGLVWNTTDLETHGRQQHQLPGQPQIPWLPQIAQAEFRIL